MPRDSDQPHVAQILLPTGRGGVEALRLPLVEIGPRPDRAAYGQEGHLREERLVLVGGDELTVSSAMTSLVFGSSTSSNRSPTWVVELHCRRRVNPAKP
jgi:hypothetical protein